MPTAILADRAAARLRAGQVWVFRSDLLGYSGAEPTSAELLAAPVAVQDRRGRHLGWAEGSAHSQIALRLISRAAEAPRPDWWRERLEAAVAFRARFVTGSEAYRVVAGEADDLPGLIVDRYGAALSVQTLTPSMAARQDEMVAWLAERLRPNLMVERNDVPVRDREHLPRRAGILLDARADSSGGDAPSAAARAEANVNGLRLEFDLLGGQKTGGFLDQRENWSAVAALARPGAAALDAFAYQGGFALPLARRGARVTAADASRAALEAGEANALRNGLEAIEWVEADAFEFLPHLARQGRRFDVVVLDPPAFAKNRAALPAAARGYKEINLRALRLLAPGGILASCSCSHHLSEAALLEIVLAAAADAGCKLTLLERRGQSLDHPVVPAIPETRYLKCLVFVVQPRW